jgi:hypothetical protein
MAARARWTRSGREYEQVVRSTPVLIDDSVDARQSDVDGRRQQAECDRGNNHPRAERGSASSCKPHFADEQTDHRGSFLSVEASQPSAAGSSKVADSKSFTGIPIPTHTAD